MEERDAETRDPVVVGVDGSAASIAALRWALHQARLTRCPVEAVHAWTASPSPFDNFSIAQAGFRSERDAARDLLTAAVAQARNADPRNGVPVRERLVAGHPAAALLASAAHARTVVLGSPRRRRLSRLRTRTVAHALLTSAPCRVVLVAADGTVVRDTAMPPAPA
jgi:nucleotide-binding universal stress UspA family protein